MFSVDEEKTNFGENETVGEIRKRLGLFSKDAVLVNKRNNRRLAILCDSERPVYWMRHIFERTYFSIRIHTHISSIKATFIPHICISTVAL